MLPDVRDLPEMPKAPGAAREGQGKKGGEGRTDNAKTGDGRVEKELKRPDQNPA